MIERFSTPEMLKIWSEKEKYRRWLLIEKAVNDVLQEHEIIPKNKLSPYLDLITSQREIASLMHNIKIIEQETAHDVVAFLFAVEQMIEPKKYGKDSRWIHYGMTSSDLVDTATAIAARQSLFLIGDEIVKLEGIFVHLEQHYKKIKIAGRTHGQYAEVMNLSDMFHGFYCMLKNLTSGLLHLYLPAKISGAVGDNKYITGQAELDILKALHLNRAVATQVVPRHHHAQLISRLALIASALESFVLQIRLYQQSGIEEMFEPFGEKQTGSSAMPHKRNPILCENVTGLARLVRSYVAPAMENISLWGQRDISHSSVERVILPDIFNLLHLMLKRTVHIFDNLVIDTDKIAENLKEVPQDSQDRLLELIREGKGRQEAYRIVQGEKK